ncbi:hypothetical protein D027_2268A, partial [Vibrio parahaemolyticus 861]
MTHISYGTDSFIRCCKYSSSFGFNVNAPSIA